MDEELEKLRIDIVETNERINKLRDIISTYFAMANDFALSSLKTSLKEI